MEAGRTDNVTDELCQLETNVNQVKQEETDRGMLISNIDKIFASALMLRTLQQRINQETEKMSHPPSAISDLSTDIMNMHFCRAKERS